jgi:ATP-dependent protease HslVU (ClpYQ) peptidase subunit
VSVIVVVSNGTRCVMASDSQATNNGAKAMLRGGGKIVRRGPYLMGSCGSMALTDVLHSLAADGAEPREGESLAQFARRFYAPMIAAEVKARGIMRRINDADEWPGQVIVARGGEFVVLDSQGGVVELARWWHAIGSGAPEARGVLFTMQHSKLIEESALMAVQAACALDDGCGGAAHFEWTDQPLLEFNDRTAIWITGHA